MKKFVLCLILILFSLNAAISQNASRLVSDFSSKENVVNMEIRKFWLLAAKPFLAVSLSGDKNNKELLPLINGTKSIKLLTLDDCDDEVRTDFIKRFQALKDTDGYETLVHVKDEGDNIRIIAKKKKDRIKELFIFIVDEDDVAVVKISGNIKMSDIAALINKYS